MTSQCELVLDHLKNHGSISSREAEKEYGIARLAARIKDLTRMGVQIRTEMVQGVNRYGKPVRYARYFLSEVDKMILDNDVEIVRPNQDGPYRLRRCKCGSGNVAYIRGVDGLWRVRCFDCAHTGPGDKVQHEAQVKWNGGDAGGRPGKHRH